MFRLPIAKFRAQTPVSISGIVLLRTATILFLLLTTIVMTMSLILRPWKTEKLEGASKYLEIGIFHVCRLDVKKGIKCYPGEHEIEGPAWFMTFRSFLLISAIFGYLSVFIPIIQLIRSEKRERNVFVASAALSLAAGCLSITALLMLIGYWDFEHLDESRKFRMGWMEDMETEESVGYPNDMAWVACVLFFFNFIICVYAHIKDLAFTKAFQLQTLRLEAEKKLNALT